MEKTKKEIKNAVIKNSNNIQNNIVISIDTNKKITKFNEECEKVLGFTKKEALYQQIFDFLIPNSYAKKWEHKINFLQKNKKIDDFELPLLDKNDQEVRISWSCFPVKNAYGDIANINLVGSLITLIKDESEAVFEFPKQETKQKKVEIPKVKHVEKEKSNNFKELNKMIKSLKRKNSELDKKNKNLEKNLNYLKNRLEQNKDKKDKKRKIEKKSDKNLQSFSEIDDTMINKQEYENMVHELDNREKLLNKLESNLMKDKEKINEKVNEFKKWRKKLESLETEIENRQKELISKEKLLTDKIESTRGITIDAPKEQKIVKYHDILDKIPDSAVVIHRGILKQVNDSFASLIRYNIDEILEKSLFDFIIPEELSEVKEFYINRLMGVEVSTFETTLLTKDNDEILVEINTKPTDFNGKKAEIAIIKTIKSKKEEK
ncbi:MAG: PAS domain-containing protein [Thermoplasmatales archaeon]|nr:MAG: PAS domain-containing protein [Thermoplasmatales archaeon]